MMNPTEYYKKIHTVFISHSSGCAGWNMPEIYQDFPLFKNGCRTLRFKDKDRGIVKMLDWDYRNWLKDPTRVEEKHLQLAREEDLEVIMSMDLWEDNVEKALAYCDRIQKYSNSNSNRVLVPVHYYCKQLRGYELAYPNANWFAKNSFPPVEYIDQITHILGGSPQSQLRLITKGQYDLLGNSIDFRKVVTLDGNQFFNVAIRHGKFWQSRKPYWYKPLHTQLPNILLFRKSLNNFQRILKGENYYA